MFSIVVLAAQLAVYYFMHWKGARKRDALELAEQAVIGLQTLGVTSYEQTYKWTIHDFEQISKLKNKQFSKCFKMNLGSTQISNAKMELRWKRDPDNEKFTLVSLFLYYPSNATHDDELFTITVRFGIINSKTDTIYPWSVQEFTKTSLKDKNWGYSKFACYEYDHSTRRLIWLPSRDEWDINSALKISCRVSVVANADMFVSAQPPDSLVQLSGDFLTLYRTHALADITLLVGGVELHAHRAVLASRSPVFRDMLQTQLEETSTNKVIITNVHHSVFDRFLHFLYSGKIELEEDAEDLLVLADQYILPSLKTACADHIAERLTIDNAARIFVKSNLYNSSVLKYATVCFIQRNKKAVMKTPGWELAEQNHLQLLFTAFVE